MIAALSAGWALFRASPFLRAAALGVGVLLIVVIIYGLGRRDGGASERIGQLQETIITLQRQGVKLGKVKADDAERFRQDQALDRFNESLLRNAPAGSDACGLGRDSLDLLRKIR